jgi:curved DNA-binding protein CbpA
VEVESEYCGVSVEKNHYQLLDISPSASMEEIKEAYLKLAFRYHPDRNQMSLTSNKIMEKINEAYATLSDPIKRRDYDIPLGYGAVVPKFKVGSKVRVVSRSSPYSDRIGTVEIEPVKDSFRFWYMVEFESSGLSASSRFAEEELIELSE